MSSISQLQFRHLQLLQFPLASAFVRRAPQQASTLSTSLAAIKHQLPIFTFLSTFIQQITLVDQYNINTTSIMGVQKQVIRSGNGDDFPKKYDEVTMEYTGISQTMHVHRNQAASHVSQDGSLMRNQVAIRANSEFLLLPHIGSTREIHVLM
jgi:hypothetical protein